jgi:hypothetical protein
MAASSLKAAKGMKWRKLKSGGEKQRRRNGSGINGENVNGVINERKMAIMAKWQSWPAENGSNGMA